MPTIYFAPNSTEISESDRAALEQAAALMKHLPPGTLVLIDGYTDRTGNRSANKKLAQHRAEAVREVLVDAGLDPIMLRAKGRGVRPPAGGESRASEGRSSTAPHGRTSRERDVELHIAR